MVGFHNVSSSPPTTGFCRLIDGTIIQVAGTNNVAGDPIQTTQTIKGHEIVFDAVGITAIRLNDRGDIEAMVAGGLNYFKAGDFEISLDKRVDMAFWKDENNKFSGLLQGWKGAIPEILLTITKNWQLLEVPPPLPE